MRRKFCTLTRLSAIIDIKSCELAQHLREEGETRDDKDCRYFAPHWPFSRALNLTLLHRAGGRHCKASMLNTEELTKRHLRIATAF